MFQNDRVKLAKPLGFNAAICCGPCQDTTQLFYAMIDPEKQRSRRQLRTDFPKSKHKCSHSSLEDIISVTKLSYLIGRIPPIKGLTVDIPR